MIVVADTSPLNYLIQIDCDNLLPQVYGRIIIPSGVIQEMSHPGAPASVRAWITDIPAWIDASLRVSAPDPELAYPGLGEQEAIQIAEEHCADLLLMDDRKGRLEAGRRGLGTTGTLGV